MKIKLKFKKSDLFADCVILLCVFASIAELCVKEQVVFDKFACWFVIVVGIFIFFGLAWLNYKDDEDKKNE